MWKHKKLSIKNILQIALGTMIYAVGIGIFLDPNKLIRVDEEHSGEERYNILGRVGKVLFVVCTLRERNTIRIISARTASLPERERYEDGEYEF